MDTLMKPSRIPSLRRMFEDFWNYESLFDGPFSSRNMQVPAVNIKENDKTYDIEVAAPGFEKEDFKLDIENNILTISAENKKENQEENGNYTRKEFSYSSFSRSFSLPEDIKEDEINAKYEKGLLHLTLQKSEKTMPERKSIPIQ